jgi:hypothetical protein
MKASAIARGGHPTSERVKQILREKMNDFYSKGNLPGNWKGGQYFESGYIRTYCPKHPCANNRGYVLEHRLVVEKMIGRFLDPGETVHHVNRVRDDNQPQNLMAFKTNSAHILMDKWGKENPEDVIFDGRHYPPPFSKM